MFGIGLKRIFELKETGKFRKNQENFRKNQKISEWTGEISERTREISVRTGKISEIVEIWTFFSQNKKKQISKMHSKMSQIYRDLYLSWRKMCISIENECWYFLMFIWKLTFPTNHTVCSTISYLIACCCEFYFCLNLHSLVRQQRLHWAQRIWNAIFLPRSDGLWSFISERQSSKKISRFYFVSNGDNTKLINWWLRVNTKC